MSDRTANLIIGVVTTVWVANIALGMAQFKGYSPSEAVNGAFMLIVGGAFVARARNQGDDKSDKGGDEQ